eukprot:CAMPEP_0170484546 /NCGR_PEP_ID=MMETSP0208-20121228/3976_1 /TAXON_ID=197538 /ORGANISM="Strombidium inclinatum, Strain S3" /LENGTH=98 /DNA_ID=CAMNT_0010757889 /DNA_START=2564 /DNA_END=2860 /DNA_ORIENTATION=-
MTSGGPLNGITSGGQTLQGGLSRNEKTKQTNILIQQNTYVPKTRLIKHKDKKNQNYESQPSIQYRNSSIMNKNDTSNRHISTAIGSEPITYRHTRNDT